MEISFLPEETGFTSMLEAMKHSPRAYALFDLARLILNKPERHLVKLLRKPADDGTRAPLFFVIPGESPFLNQHEAVRHLFREHRDLLFKAHKKPIDPPKGNFAFVNRCGITGELLGPPNYHEYQKRLVRHHQQRLAHVPFEQFKSRIQTVRDPEAVKAWIESMSFKVEYEYLLEPSEPVAATPPPSPSPVAEPSPTPAPVAAAPSGEISAAPSGSPAPAEKAEPAAARTAVPAPGKIFSSLDELEKYFVERHLAQLIVSAPELKTSGQASRHIPHGGILEAVRQAWESERKFPLRTANEIRSRLRREGFHFFKHHKDITYISIIKPRRFESLNGLKDQIVRLVTFLRANDGCNRKQMLEKMIAAAAPAQTAGTDSAPASGAAIAPSAPPEPGAAPTVPAPPTATRDPQLEESLLVDLRWLISEGYVVEFSDGRLWALEDRPPQPPPKPKQKPAEAIAAPASPEPVAQEIFVHEPDGHAEATPVPAAVPSAPARLGVIHYNFPGFSFPDFLQFAAESGYGFVELQIPDVWGRDVANPEVNAERVRQQVESYGLKVSALAAHNDFVQLDDEAIRLQVDRMKRICGLARMLHEEAVIRSEGGAPKDSVPKEKWLEAMHGCFKRCIPFLEEMKIGLAIDNHGLVTNDGDLLYTLLRRLDCKWIGSNLDTMNFRWFGHEIATCDRFYEMLAPHVLHTHLKDGFGCRENYKGAALGEGEIHLAHALGCLRKAGYAGVFCAEYEGPEAQGGIGYRKCCDWMKTNVRGS